MFSDSFIVGAPPPTLVTSAAPVASDGTVTPGTIVTFAVAVTNTSGVTLTSVVLSNTIPVDLTIITGTLSDGGMRNGDTVRWTTTGLAPQTSRFFTYSVFIPPDFVSNGQWRYMTASPR